MGGFDMGEGLFKDEIQEEQEEKELKKIILPETAFEVINRYNLASTKEKEAKQEREAIKFELMELLGDCQLGICGALKVTIKEQSRGTLDAKRLSKAHPDIYKEFLNVTSFIVVKTGQIK